jgi:hypothetical protein
MILEANLQDVYIHWKWNMSRYTSIGFEGFKEILTIFVNIYLDSCLAVVVILVRKGILALLFSTSHTPISHSITIHRWK